MATPKLDTLILQFRRDVADNYNRTSGAPIAAASEDGNDWSAQEVTDLVVQAINEYMSMIAQGVGSDPKRAGAALSFLMPEYKTPVALPFQLMAQPGYYGAYSEVALPSDYAYFVSGALAEGSRYRPARFVTDEKLNMVLSGLVREARAPYFTIVGSTLRVCSIDMPISGQSPPGPTQTLFDLVYIHSQAATVQGAGTDILLRAHHNPNILKLMKIISVRYKAQ